MKSSLKHVVFSTILCALTVFLFLAFYKRLPESIPVHFDATGNPNSFWPRNVVVFGGPIAYCIINLLIGLQFKKKEMKTAFVYYVMPLLAFVITGMVIYLGIKYSLQGTTQSRYLTGGVPPVRFSM